jgi:hypothetical protein
MEEVNELGFQIASKKTLSAIDHQGKTINSNIAKVQAQNVVFWLLDDIELVDWTTTIFLFARLWFCEDIHRSSILKLAIEKAIQKSTNANLSSKLFQYDSNYEKNQFLGFVSSHKNGTLLTSFHIHSLLVHNCDMHPHRAKSHFVKYAGLVTSDYAIEQYPHVSSFFTVITNEFVG